MLGSLIVWIIVGAIAGWLASIVMKTNAQQGLLTDIIVGIVGGFIGGFILNALNIGTTPGVDGINDFARECQFQPTTHAIRAAAPASVDQPGIDVLLLHFFGE